MSRPISLQNHCNQNKDVSNIHVEYQRPYINLKLTSKYSSFGVFFKPKFTCMKQGSVRISECGQRTLQIGFVSLNSISPNHQNQLTTVTSNADTMACLGTIHLSNSNYEIENQVTFQSNK